jgi:7,8-dihydroneopterin aldolase/epimerase/oxygenase
LEHKKHADRITLSGIIISPRIGITSEERSSPQDCHADLTIWGDFKAAAATDSLNQSIDYCQILSVVQETALTGEYQLLETLAYAIIQKVLQNFSIIRTRVKIRKRPESLLGKLDFVEIEIEGTQPEC